MTMPSLSVVMIVQADTTTGLGHLVRSAALMRALEYRGYRSCVYLVADEVGQAKAHALDLPQYDGENLPACAIIDALSVTSIGIGWLKNFPKRILISPVFDCAEIATHAFMRCVDSTTSSRLSSECVTEVDFDFSFATSGGLVPRDLSYATLNVGICLTGGDDKGRGAELATALLRNPQVDSVFLASRKSLNGGTNDDRFFWCRDSNTSSWQFFSNINLFIGADGIMVAEAISQNIPVISYGVKSDSPKIAPLATAGCLRATIPGELASIIPDRQTLLAMHNAARRYRGLCREPKLAIRVMKELGEGELDD